MLYSSNNEEFYIDNLPELIYNDELQVGDKVWIGEPLTPKPSAFFHIDHLIEEMGERAMDDFDDYADDFPNISQDKIDELNKLISDWLDQNIKVKFYAVVNIREHIITEDDCKESKESFDFE